MVNYLGHYESPPYSDNALRSVYHLRELEVYRMAHITAVTSMTHATSAIGSASSGSNSSSNSSGSVNHSGNNVDIFMSHDWPSGVWEYGDKQRLLRSKPYFQEDMISGKLGSYP